MRDEFAWRWVCFHAAVFALASLALNVATSCGTLDTPMAVFFAAFALSYGLPLGLAQAVGLRVKRGAWCAATCLGFFLGLFAQEGLRPIQGYVVAPFLYREGYSQARLAFAVLVWVTMGSLLGGVPGAYLGRGRSARAGFSWLLWTTLAWTLASAIDWFLDVRRLFPDSSLSFRVAVVAFIKGMVFGLVLLPAASRLRKEAA